MFVKKLFCLTGILFTLMPVFATEQGKNTPPSLTLWLMPALPPIKDTPVSGSQFEKNLADFNGKFGAGSPVTVLNTTKPDLLSQLIAWNPEYAGPSWAMIKGQEEALEELARFARENRIHINVRFINWGKAFSELKDAAEAKKQGGRSEELPDLAQIGSTWVAYFASQGFLIPYTQGDLLTHDAPSIKNASVQYSVDARLIFYWKRNHLDLPSGSEFKLESESWESLVQSLKNRVLEKGPYPNPPMVMPIGLTLDLLHNYTPLVWAGGSEFLYPDRFGAKVDLEGRDAMKIPLFLARNATVKEENNTSRPLLTFPEMSTEEATGHFMDGDYIAIHKPAGFIKRWYEKFAKDQSRQTRKEVSQVVFWDYAGVAIPPKPFKGGSDLMVLNGAGDKELAFSLARFLATDERFTSIMARYEGYLPAQKKNYGVEYLIDSLQKTALSAPETSPAAVIPHKDMVALTTEYSSYVERAVNGGKEYMQLESFPVDIESHESLEAIQRLMRRIGEGDEDGRAGDRMEGTAIEAQIIINQRINGWIGLIEGAKRQWKLVLMLFLILIVLAFWMVLRQLRISRKESELTKHVNKVRGFTSSALLSIYDAHNIIGKRYDDLEASANGRDDAKKALIVIDGLEGWIRGLDPRNWEPLPLERVAWVSIILALQSTGKTDIFEEWKKSGESNAQAFLKEKGYVRENSAISKEKFYFCVDSLSNVQVQTPFMLEQAFVCLLQNAIKASINLDGKDHPISISYNPDSDSVIIQNDGCSPCASNKKLCDVLNKSVGLTQFKEEIYQLLLGSDMPKPGIGLVEAYTIATQCYGGLLLDGHEDKPRISIRLNSKRKEKPWLSKVQKFLLLKTLQRTQKK
jgi:ABC-type glycerol-3-phosphate transport system substrate-binding protein